MPVNTAALKTFAPAMRRQLLEAVGRKLDLLLNSQTPDTLSTYSKQIAELREQEEENREQLLERVAYTWFNRLCALRYLDARGWHPFGCKVLMPAAEGETQPELLKLMRAGSLPAELKPLTNEARLHGLLDGQIPPAIAGADPQGEVYRELLLASCRSYHQLLPELFEGLDDASELLLPDDLLSEGSIAGGFRSAISDADCEDVEIIGWLYQFYISEKKDQVIGKVVKSEDIPAATQLFTPNWIVKYMVQNSLGATWLATYADSPLKGQMEFYIEPAEQTHKVQAQLATITPESLDPEELTLIDPACGSGHILVEAYDLLKAIYLELGYRQSDIPELILTKNLFGLDICPRAAQLAAFSLLMKGREDDRRLLERGIRLNVMVLKDSTCLNVERLVTSMDLSAAGVTRADVRMLVDLFTHAITFGSLIEIPAFLVEKLTELSRLTEQNNSDLFGASDLQLLAAIVRQTSLLARRYSAVVANPPYMGSGSMNTCLKEFAGKNYEPSKADLFSCFISRCLSFTKEDGYCAMVTMQGWMFLSSFETLRNKVVCDKTISSMVHIGFNSFPSLNSKVALATAFAIINRKINGFLGSYIDLNKEAQSADKGKAFLEKRRQNRFVVDSEQFAKIPGSPISYSASFQMFRLFADYPHLGSIATPRKGMVTADNPRFIRCWHEVSWASIGIGCHSRQEALASGRKWFPYAKGGSFRRWSGNSEYVINWENDGKELLGMKTEGYKVGSTNHNLEFIFKPAITWTKICIDSAFRLSPNGFLYDDASGLCPANEGFEWLVLALLNTPVAARLLDTLNPTLNLNPGNLSSIPVNTELRERVQVAQCVSDSNDDWNAYERSWHFTRIPALDCASALGGRLDAGYSDWISRNNQIISKARLVEEANNRLFIDAYGLQDEMAADFPIDKITLTINPDYRYGGNISLEEKWSRFQRDTMAEFLSYTTGCMMGRYSLDQPGLILADPRESQADQLSAYEAKVGKPLSEVQFKPDFDGIIPVLDSEWFEDDIVARSREFLGVTFPESSVGENLRFIEESLRKDIRKYFCTEFYKDHLQTYKKRPIYWMVQSPKKGFACLIYLHRYTKDTLNQVLNNYFRPYLQKLEARLAQLGLDQLNDDLPARDRTAARKEAEKISKVLKECQAWEQDALLPLAQQRIPLDLDDGVKVNYLKLQDVLAPIPGLAAKEE